MLKTFKRNVQNSSNKCSRHFKKFQDIFFEHQDISMLSTLLNTNTEDVPNIHSGHYKRMLKTFQFYFKTFQWNTQDASKQIFKTKIFK